jgi:prohibitin 1
MVGTSNLRYFNFRALPVVTLSAITLVTLIFGSKFVAIIPAGHVGVVDSFGKISQNTLKPGINVINPLSSVETFSTRTKEMKQTLDSPSKEGLILNLEVSVLYHVDPQKAQQLYQTVGGNYEEVIVVPLMRSIVRQVTASHDAQSLYTSQRQQLSEQIRQQLSQQLSPRGIIVEETPLRKLELPET